MVDISKTVAVIFDGDDRITNTVRGINRSFSDFSKITQNVAAPLANVAEGVIATDAALAAMAIGGMALAIRESGKFGDSFNEIATLIDVPRDRLGDFRRDIVEYAKDSTASFEDINAAVYTAISAGTDYARSLDVLSTSEKLATAGKADLEATTRLLASTLNAYGAGVDQATRYSDVFFRTVKEGQTTLPELADSLSQVTGIAANAGIPIETLMAALAALTATGAPTSQAITQIRGAIAAIIKPSQQAQEMAKSLGIEFGVAALKSKGFEGILRDVFAATGGNVDMMAKLFGRVEGLNAALVLGADKSGKFAKALESMRNAAGATEEAFKKMAENINQINQTLANNVRAILIGLGDEMLGGYIGIAKGIQDVLKQIETGIDAGIFDPLFDAFDEFAANLSEFLSSVAEALPEAMEQLDFSSFLRGLGDLGDAIQRLFDDVDLTTAEGLSDALQEIIDTGEALVRVTAGMAVAFEPYFEALRESVRRVNDWDEETQAAFGRVLVAAEGIARAGTAIGLGMALISEKGASITSVFDSLIGTFDALYGGILTIRYALVELILESFRLIVDGAAQFSQYLASIPGFDYWDEKINDASKSLDSWIKAARSAQQENLGKMFDGIKLAADGIPGIFDKGTESVGKFAKAVDGVPETIESRVEFSDEIAKEDIREIQQYLQELEDDPTTLEILPFEPPDDSKLQQAVKKIREQEILIDVALNPEIDTEAAERALKELEVRAGVLKEAMKIAAELEITQAQEATKRLQAAFESVNVSIQSTGETLASLIGSLVEVEGISKRWLIEDAIRQEMELRQQSFDLQRRLVNSTINLNKQKAERLKSGDALITISADGLGPALEMVIWEIAEMLQLRVIESGKEALIDLAGFGGL